MGLDNRQRGSSGYLLAISATPQVHSNLLDTEGVELSSLEFRT